MRRASQRDTQIYEEFEKTMDKKACCHHIVMSDFNAITEVRNID